MSFFETFKIAKNKQATEALKSDNEITFCPASIQEISLRRTKRSWDMDEARLLEMAFQKYGEDHAAIADLLGTKNQRQVQSFFEKWRQSSALLSENTNFQKLPSLVVQELNHESIEVTKSTQSPLAKISLTFFPHRTIPTKIHSRLRILK